MLSLLLAASLVVVRPVIVQAEGAEDVKTKCGIDRPIDGCTRFVGYGLKASCDSDGKLTASATVTPIVVLLANEAHSHELQHLADIEASLNDYIRDLESAKYSSVGNCEWAAASAMNDFELTLQRAVAHSNLKRHANLRKAALERR